MHTRPRQLQVVCYRRRRERPLPPPGGTRPPPGASAERVQGSPRPTRIPVGSGVPARREGPPGGPQRVWGWRGESRARVLPARVRVGSPRPPGAAPGPGCGVAEEINASRPWRGDTGQRVTWPGSGGTEAVRDSALPSRVGQARLAPGGL